MKKFLVVLAVAVSSVGFGQNKQITSKQIHKADSIVKSNIDFKLVEAELVVLINNYRSSKNLNVLLYDTNLCSAAKFQVTYNISLNKLTHDNTPSGYKNVIDRVEKFTGIRPNTAGEILAQTNPLFSVAYNRTIAEELFQQWKDSPGHNAVMLSNRMITIGLYVNRKDSNSGAIYGGVVVNSL